MYNHAHGLYADTWSAWTELAINIIVTVIAGYLWGIIGILLGKIISTGIIIVLWKPYYLFHSGLQLKYSKYWEGSIRNYLASIISFIVAHIILNIFVAIKVTGFYSLTWYCILCTIIYLLINMTLILLLCRGAKNSILRLKSIIKRS